MSHPRPVVVTGGAGFIGSHVVDRLLTDGLLVRVVDDLSTGSVENLTPSVTLDEFDLAGADAADRIASLRPAVVIHCAAQASVAGSFRDPVADAQSNIVASLNVIRGALDAGADRFIYMTTGGALYGHPTALPCTEDHPVAPLSPYGWSKWIVEKYLDVLATGRLPWMALRLANVYGPRQRPGGEAGVIAIFADQMRRGAPVMIEGDGEQTRDFLFVTDVADAVAAAMRGRGRVTINVGTGLETSINQLFSELAAISGYRIGPVHSVSRPGDIRRSALDPSHAIHLLGWRARTGLREGLRRTYEALADGHVSSHGVSRV